MYKHFKKRIVNLQFLNEPVQIDYNREVNTTYLVHSVVSHLSPEKSDFFRKKTMNKFIHN